MSILINGMEMPTEDEEIIIRIDSSGTVMTEYALPISWAKAVPVPPHGRLGDLDELYAHLNEWYLTNNPVFAKEESIYIRAMLLGISEAPTIIPADGKDTGVPTREGASDD